MDTQFTQEIIDRAVRFATKSARNGRPLAQVIWIPTMSATQDPYGTFASVPYESGSAADSPPWDS